jgi:hypothetical protein
MNKIKVRGSFGRAIGIMASVSTLALASAAITPSASWATLTDGKGIALNVLSPKPNSVIKTSVLQLRVTATDYHLEAGFAGSPVSLVTPYVGHYHEILDGKLIDMTPVDTPNSDTISMVGVKPGRHVLTIVPALNDHSMVMSAAVNIPFTYVGKFLPQPAGYEGTGSSNIVISSPADGSTVTGDTFTLSANITNFVVFGNSFGKALVPGQGHWHIFVDQPMMANMITMSSTPDQVVSIKGLTPGLHTFWAVLVDNHHMPFMDPTTKMMQMGTAASIQLNVQRTP